MIKTVLSSESVPRGYKIMVRESNGSSLSNKICNFFNPWPETSCSRVRCLVCNSTNTSPTSKDCWTSGVTYRLNCNLCADQGVTAQYEGESSRSCFSRGSRHLRDLETRKPGTPLGDHSRQYHPGIEMNKDHINMQCTGKFSKPTQRLTSEGLEIEKLLKAQKLAEKG